MSLRDDAFDIGGQTLADLPYGAYYPAVKARLSVVCDLPVEWSATATPARVSTGGSAPRVTPIRQPVRQRVRTCVEIPPIYACHRVRVRVHAIGTVAVASIIVSHRARVVDPLPDILVEDDDLLILLAAIE